MSTNNQHDDASNETYFTNNVNRAGETKTEEIAQIASKVLEDLKTKHTEVFKNFSNENLFLTSLASVVENDEKKDKKCDEVFAEYLHYVSKICNETFFKDVVKFVILFRENVNIVNKNQKFSEENTAEDAPDSSNEFILEFLCIDSGNKFSVKKEESIELTQNLCSWMFRNNYSHSKLALC